MNIHFFHPDPNMNARMLPDVWLRSDIKELAQIMSTICYVNGTWTEQMYKPYNPNGRFVKWGIKSAKNELWMCCYAQDLINEYRYRFEKYHKSSSVLRILISKYMNTLEKNPLLFLDLIDMDKVMSKEDFPEAFGMYKPKGDTVFERYRNYLLLREKNGLKMKWTNY